METLDSDAFCSSYDYEPAEQEFDDHEPEDFINAEDIEGQEDGEGGYGEESYAPNVNSEQVVVSGDLNAGYSGKVMEQAREKKVPNEQRSTTPYMTKYERARVLGTRALQIRFVWGYLVWIGLFPANTTQYERSCARGSRR